MGARDDLLERADLPAVRRHFLPLGVNLRHLGTVVDAVDLDPPGAEKIEQLADERAGIDEETANANTTLRGADTTGENITRAVAG
jgi:hypothetical protein